jgi:hypothetical protein
MSRLIAKFSQTMMFKDAGEGLAVSVRQELLMPLYPSLSGVVFDWPRVFILERES